MLTDYGVRAWISPGAGVFAVALLLAGCPQIFTDGLDNPIDPKADSYQGFETVDHPDEVRAVTASGVEMIWPEFLVSKLNGATGYHLQIATEAGFSPDTIVYDKEDFTNHLMRSAGDLEAGVTYYWRVRAHGNDVTGSWTEVRSFTVANMMTGMSPLAGGVTLEDRPTLSWAAVDGAMGYEVQAAETEQEVRDASAVGTTATTLEFPFDLDSGHTRYWRVRATDGEGYGAWSGVFSVIGPFEIGDVGPAQGVISFIDVENTHDWAYLEAWTADESGSFQWKTSATRTSGTSRAIGSGFENTYSAMSGTQHPAAQVARNASHGGFNDWFLPSMDELNLMYHQRELIGGFTSGNYWTSTQLQDYFAVRQDFDDGSGNSASVFKTQGHRVRVVRAF